MGARAANGSWEVAGYAKNLFNTQRIVTRDAVPSATSFAVGAALGSIVTPYRAISTTDPREFGISARFAFGSR